MRNRMMGVIVVGVLLVAGAAMAQTAGSSLGPAPPGIIPVTGPSTMPGFPEPSKLEVTEVMAQGEVGKGEGARASSTIRTPAASTTHQTPRAVQAVHTPSSKATVKKASAPKRVAKAAAGPAKTKHVPAAKRQVAPHQATVSKPIPLTKPEPPAKGSAPAQPVLPRV